MELISRGLQLQCYTHRGLESSSIAGAPEPKHFRAGRKLIRTRRCSAKPPHTEGERAPQQEVLEREVSNNRLKRTMGT